MIGVTYHDFMVLSLFNRNNQSMMDYQRQKKLTYTSLRALPYQLGEGEVVNHLIESLVTY
jgi:hypothetical protein